MKGTIRFIHSTGFGFIIPEEQPNKEDKSKDVYMHLKGVVKGETVKGNDTVEYEITDTTKGKAAKNIRKVK